ncbi:dTDP-4-dehydrorhamnose 3,5-epimerase [Campylobacter jejuni]|uniref:dTDP-4-dehydrorhamnose 3,5-epimerase n=2 Tax=Campylobacter TaxID=194 RepID=UPI000B3F96EE|nr:dTDP-4-dehydrorhamnose 3,5-epimerase [Campylobacter jejuni]EAI1813093.1 dTDP-4-dehydrorhamnose 3,5-epimerase [Campylobacter jejuni]EAK4950122.1 dTDP-4-dehydrorhamnose 3,5-epimerase [Campylobacter jejuni]ECQ8672877.1 dTDP-4-dehydrorhamnose 3,5-epimerase [Campylobacter jejuni]MBX0734683.1 dTDP-4-dehydrorhamnose 3,5-epimerase [Campylobacter jejuni]MGX74514.1 dTDP-4-dehydrorhamnose 3,5-epimerase [Campylobacter jejuni]
MSRFNFMKACIEGVYIIEPKPICDERGYFERYFCANDFEEIGMKKPIIQINHSKTIGKGSIRGMHYQIPPFCETKIVRCLKGSILDVAIDIRKNSPTFLQYFSIELNEVNNKYLYIPEGFAHGFQVLSDEAEILYLVTQEFNSSADRGINPFDKAIISTNNFYQRNRHNVFENYEGGGGIKWPLEIGNISRKDLDRQYIDKNFIGIEI